MTALTNIKIWDQEYKNVDSVQYNYAKSEEKALGAGQTYFPILALPLN